MARLPRLEDSELTPEQLEIRRAIAERRGGFLPKPHEIWTLRPDMARPAQELGWYFQTGSSLPDRLSELAMLLIGRLWLADYVWRTHLPRARRAGLSEAVIAALDENRPPEFSAEDERLVYDFVTRLHAERALDDQLYARAVRLLGRDGIIDLTGLVGYFSLIAMTIKVFEA